MAYLKSAKHSAEVARRAREGMILPGVNTLADSELLVIL